MQNDCNVGELSKNLKALEILEEVADDLAGGTLHSGLKKLIDEQRAECQRIGSECGNLDVASLLEDLEYAPGEVVDPEILAGLATPTSATEDE